MVHHRLLARLRPRPRPRRARGRRPRRRHRPPPGAARRAHAEYGDSVHPLALDVTDAAAARVGDRRGSRALRPARRRRQQRRLRQRRADRDHRRRKTSARSSRPTSGASTTSRRRRSRVLRAQGGGLVMQFSSVGGRVGGSPGIASYQAAKFAIDGFSRVLQAETAPFGVKVIVVEPSGFETDWAGSSMIVRDIPEAYAATVGAMNTRVRQNPDGPPGDPVRAAEILVQGREAPRHPLPPAARRDRGRGLDPARRAAPGRRPQMAGREPLRRLRPSRTRPTSRPTRPSDRRRAEPPPSRLPARS